MKKRFFRRFKTIEEEQDIKSLFWEKQRPRTLFLEQQIFLARNPLKTTRGLRRTMYQKIETRPYSR
jgi:hypothetical protein